MYKWGPLRVLGDRRNGEKVWQQTIFKVQTSDRNYQENCDNYFATAINCMQHNQTNMQFLFLFKSDSDNWYDRTSDRAVTKGVTGDKGYPLGGPHIYEYYNKK